MAQALGSHPHVFPRLFIDMVRTAETGGNLDNTLQQRPQFAWLLKPLDQDSRWD